MTRHQARGGGVAQVVKAKIGQALQSLVTLLEIDFDIEDLILWQSNRP